MKKLWIKQIILLLVSLLLLTACQDRTQPDPPPPDDSNPSQGGEDNNDASGDDTTPDASDAFFLAYENAFKSPVNFTETMTVTHPKTASVLATETRVHDAATRTVTITKKTLADADATEMWQTVTTSATYDPSAVRATLTKAACGQITIDGDTLTAVLTQSAAQDFPTAKTVTVAVTVRNETLVSVTYSYRAESGNDIVISFYF